MWGKLGTGSKEWMYGIIPFEIEPHITGNNYLEKR
jgi:hypothetical protein